jgi:threonylcarbamoyladenosine tRNA methylthiotransferase MtaB
MQQGKLPRVQVGDILEERVFQDGPLHSFHRHTRAFLKIQDGCNASCSYCIVPRARGPSRSLSAEKVIESLTRLKEKGFKEVVLTGIHIGGYGSDLSPATSLEGLLERIEQEETPARVRLSSIEPLDFSEGLIDLLSGSSKVCPHLHIPIQSGNDEILKSMNRNYNRSFLIRLIREIHDKIPGASIGADVIAGFPGESEERFASTCELIEVLPFSYLHVFPYSKRKGTPAALFPEPVGGRVIKQRAGQLRELGKKKREAFYRRFLDEKMEVLIEGRVGKDQNRLKGLSRNYVPVSVSPESGSTDPSLWINRERTVLVTGISESGVTGKILEE